MGVWFASELPGGFNLPPPWIGCPRSIGMMTVEVERALDRFAAVGAERAAPMPDDVFVAILEADLFDAVELAAKVFQVPLHAVIRHGDLAEQLSERAF